MAVWLIAGILWAAGLAGLFAAAVSDFKHRVIPNRLVALTAGCGGALRLLSQPQTIAISLASAAAILLVLGLPVRRELIGGGDAKLIAAVTLLVRPGQIIALLLSIAVVGGLLSCGYLLAQLILRRDAFMEVAGKRGQRRPFLPKEFLRKESFGAKVKSIAEWKSVPYGLAIFGGTAFLALVEAIRCFYATC